MATKARLIQSPAEQGRTSGQLVARAGGRERAHQSLEGRGGGSMGRWWAAWSPAATGGAAGGRRKMKERGDGGRAHHSLGANAHLLAAPDVKQQWSVEHLELHLSYTTSLENTKTYILYSVIMLATNNSIFLLHKSVPTTTHQSVSNIFLLKQISTINQPQPAE